ncbi:MAG: MarR family winged helix-turn-helix transcriptional regulator [Thermaerobacterales bacterium]
MPGSLRIWPGLPEAWEQRLSDAERLSGLISRTLYEACNLGSTQYQVLAQLEIHGSVTLSYLSEALSCTRGNMTGVAERLRSQELIKRTAHPDDARSSLIELTAAGRRRLQEADAALAQLAAEHEGIVDQGPAGSARRGQSAHHAKERRPKPVRRTTPEGSPAAGQPPVPTDATGPGSKFVSDRDPQPVIIISANRRPVRSMDARGDTVIVRSE